MLTTERLFLLLLAFPLLFSVSCVSTGKYQALQADYYRLRSDSSQLAKNYQAMKEGLQEQVESTADTRYELSETETDLENLRERLRQQAADFHRMNATIKEALVDFDETDLSVYEKDGKVYISLSEKFLFDSGSAWVHEEAKGALQKLANVLNTKPDLKIEIEGHTDNVPYEGSAFKDNWDLSTSRATAIARLLTDDYRVDPNRLKASGKSMYDPVAPNSTEAGRQRNRRTDIIVLPDLSALVSMLEGE